MTHTYRGQAVRWLPRPVAGPGFLADHDVALARVSTASALDRSFPPTSLSARSKRDRNKLRGRFTIIGVYKLVACDTTSKRSAHHRNEACLSGRQEAAGEQDSCISGLSSRPHWGADRSSVPANLPDAHGVFASLRESVAYCSSDDIKGSRLCGAPPKPPGAAMARGRPEEGLQW